MSSKFAAGDLVMLKSGGPVMTIERLIDNYGANEATSYFCSWFAGAKDNGKVFAEAALEAYKDE